MKLFFIRHGEPDYTIDSLTPKGRREAELLADRLTQLPPAEGYYCSPCGRAKDTAAPTMQRLGKQVEILPWLAEFRGNIKDPETGNLRIPWDLKPQYWQNQTLLLDAEHWTEHPLMKSGTISVADIYEETCNGFDAVLAHHGYIRKNGLYCCENNREGYLIFFCHMALTMAILGYLTHVSPFLLWHGYCLPPSSVTTVITEERSPGLVSFRCFQAGDTSHLAIGNEPPSRMAMFQEVFHGTDSTSAT